MSLPGVQLKKRFLDVPIIQGGMGVGISLGGLAGAVMKEGGLGVVSAAHPGYQDPSFWSDSVQANVKAIQKEAEKARRISEGHGLLGLNVMVASRDYETYVRAGVAAGYDVLLSGAGLPLSLPELAGESEILLAPIVSSARALELLIKVWQKRYARVPDLVVIEGPLAGGHLGFKEADLQSGQTQALEAILEDVLQLLKEKELAIPVFAAGGVYSHEDIEGLLEKGAAGVQMATRFIATVECDAAPAFKQALIDSRPEQLRLLHSPAGWPGRALQQPGRRNRPENCIRCLKRCDFQSAGFCLSQALIAAVSGELEEALVFAGANAGRLSGMLTVAELMKELKEGRQ